MEIKKLMYQGITDSINKLFKGLSGFIMPELYFSDDEPKEDTYGGNLTDEEIFKELQKIKEKYYKKYPHGGNYIEPLTGLEARWVLYDYLQSPDRDFPSWVRDLMDEVKDTLGKKKCSLTIWAYYDSVHNRITVFTKAFDKYSQPEKDATVRLAVAHEVFHALHSYFAPRTYKGSSYEAEVVREALADFYSYVLSLDEDAAIADSVDIAACKDAARSRFDFWEGNIFYDIPYANAIFCMFKDGSLRYAGKYEDCINNGALDKLLKVLNISKSSMKSAYEELVPEPFRKKPSHRFKSSAGTKRGGRRIGYGRSKVDDIGFDNGDVRALQWEIIKAIIRDNDLGSLEEVQGFFPRGVIEIIRGRFITLESGEILSAYPQWKVLDEKKFLKFATDLGYISLVDILKKSTAEYTVVKVEIGSGQEYTYLFDPEDNSDIKPGDKVICQNKNGSRLSGTVTEVLYMDEDEYEAYCRRIHYSDLSIAKRAYVLSDGQIIHFHYRSGGGFIMIDPMRYNIDVDRLTGNVELYDANRHGKHNVVSFKADKKIVDKFFDALDNANWEDGPFVKTAGPDCATWELELESVDGFAINPHGAYGDGPKNGKTIQGLLGELLHSSNQKVNDSGEIFGLE